MAAVIGWHELYTSDVDAATSFYAELLGAEIERAQMTELEYPMLKKDGRTHAGFFFKDAEHEQVPSHWYPYFEVDDVDAAVEQAKSLGSDVFHGPATVEEAGIRLAVLGDPQHATFGVLTSPNPAPSGLFVWDELHAADVEAAKRYYSELLGWTTESFMDGYDVFKAGETLAGGLMPKSEDLPVAAWLSYIAVDDTDAATTKARELGATLLMEPTTMENVGRFSVLADPTGAAFGLHHSTSR